MNPIEKMMLLVSDLLGIPPEQIRLIPANRCDPTVVGEWRQRIGRLRFKAQPTVCWGCASRQLDELEAKTQCPVSMNS